MLNLVMHTTPRRGLALICPVTDDVIELKLYTNKRCPSLRLEVCYTAIDSIVFC